MTRASRQKEPTLSLSKKGTTPDRSISYDLLEIKAEDLLTLLIELGVISIAGTTVEGIPNSGVKDRVSFYKKAKENDKVYLKVMFDEWETHTDEFNQSDGNIYPTYDRWVDPEDGNGHYILYDCLGNLDESLKNISYAAKFSEVKARLSAKPTDELPHQA